MISPDVLNIPQCTHGIPHMHHDIPNVLNIPQCIHDIPLPHALMVPSDVFNTPDILMIFPQCTEDPPDVLNHTLYRVVLCLYQVHKWKYSSFFSCSIVNLCISNVTQSIVLQFVENLKKNIFGFSIVFPWKM